MTSSIVYILTLCPFVLNVCIVMSSCTETCEMLYVQELQGLLCLQPTVLPAAVTWCLLVLVHLWCSCGYH